MYILDGVSFIAPPFMNEWIN